MTLPCPSTLTLRRLSAGDVAVLRAARLAALRQDPDSFASTASDWLGRSDEDLRAMLAAEPIFVAVDQGQTVGMIGLVPSGKSKLAHRWGVAMVFVAQSHRGGGVADRLLLAAVDCARDAGALQLELTVAACNRRAFRFYQRHGFQITGRVPRGFRSSDGFVDELTMVLPLDS